MTRKLVLISWNASDYNIAKWDAVFKTPTLLFHHLVLSLSNTCSTGKLLHARHINAVHASSIIGKEGS